MATNSMDTGRDFFHLLIRSGSEVILVGVDGARIVPVSSERVGYIDNSAPQRCVRVQKQAPTRAKLLSENLRRLVQCFLPILR
jgi:hypothetical protein